MTTRVLAHWKNEDKNRDKDKGGCEALLAMQAHQHRNRVRRKIFHSIKRRSMAGAFALWKAYGDASVRGDGVGGVVGREGTEEKGGEEEFLWNSSFSPACLAITPDGGGGGEAPRGCMHALEDGCQICFAENPRQTACSHGHNDASYDDLEAGLLEAGLC